MIEVPPAVRRSLLWALLLVPGAFLIGATVVRVPVQVVVLPLGLGLLTFLPRRVMPGLLIVVVVSLGLARRLVSGGRVDYDPLLLLPLVLVAVMALGAVGKREIESGERLTQRFLLGAIVVFVTSLLLAIVVNPSNVFGLYTTGVHICAFLLIGLIATGKTPDPWEFITKRAPVLAIVVSGYALVQFFLLPSWDRQWMIASDLKSIGAPNPLELRAFGMSEAPGALAAVLAILIISLIAQIESAKSVIRKAILATALLMSLVALFVSGVRIALIAIAVSLAWMALRRPTPGRLIVVGGAFSLGMFVLLRGLSLLSNSGNSILAEGRYTGFDAASDNSLQSRVRLLAEIPPALINPLGTPGALLSGRLDNLYIDVLVAYGIIAVVSLVVVLVLAVNNVIRLRVHGAAPGLAEALIATVVLTLAGNVLATTTGLLLALVIGAALRERRPLVAEGSGNSSRWSRTSV